MFPALSVVALRMLVNPVRPPITAAGVVTGPGTPMGPGCPVGPGDPLLPPGPADPTGPGDPVLPGGPTGPPGPAGPALAMIVGGVVFVPPEHAASDAATMIVGKITRSRTFIKKCWPFVEGCEEMLESEISILSLGSYRSTFCWIILCREMMSNFDSGNVKCLLWRHV